MNFPGFNYELLTLVFFSAAVLTMLLTVILSIVWDLGRLVSDVSGRTAKREISKLENRNRANSDGILDTNSDLYAELTSRNLQMPSPEPSGSDSAPERVLGEPEMAFGEPEDSGRGPEESGMSLAGIERSVGVPERALGDPGIDFGNTGSDTSIPFEGYVEPARSYLEDDQGTNTLENGYADSLDDLNQEDSYDTNTLDGSGIDGGHEDSYDTNMLDGSGIEGVQEDSYDTNMLDGPGTEDSYDTNMLDGSDVDDFVRVVPESHGNAEDSYDTNMLDQEDTEELYDTNILDQEDPEESYTKPRLVLEISSY